MKLLDFRIVIMIVDFHCSANEISYNARNACIFMKSIYGYCFNTFTRATLLVLSLSYYTEIAYIVHIVDNRKIFQRSDRNSILIFSPVFHHRGIVRSIKHKPTILHSQI